MRLRAQKIAVAVVCFAAGVCWLAYATVRQAHRDEALIRAVYANHTAAALSLLRQGADPNARDYGKEDTSYWPLLKRRFQRLFARKLLSGNDLPPSALALAVHQDNSAIVADLLARGATGVNDTAVFSLSGYGDAPNVALPLLLGAAQNGDIAIVKGLLEHGARINVLDADGNNALLLCLAAVPYSDTDGSREDQISSQRARMRYASVARLLIERGIDVRHANMKEGTTALYTAAHRDDLPGIVDLLLARGADPNARPVGEPDAPIAGAALYNDAHMLMALLHKGARVNPTDGSSPPIVSASGLETLRILLDHGADPNAHDVDRHYPEDLPSPGSTGGTALISNSYANALPLVRLLLSRGAAVNARDDRDATALVWAARNADGRCIRLLVEHGADINARSASVGTALIAAAGGRRDDNIRVLVHYGAKLNLKDGRGETALMIAANLGDDPVILTLLEAGAAVNLQTDDGSTALDDAVDQHNPDYAAAIALLKKHGARPGHSILPR